MLRESYIEHGAYHIYCRQNSELKEQVPVLFLHGLGSTSEIYSAAMDIPCLQGNILMLDLLGHGRSDKPLDFSYDLMEQVACVHSVMEHLGLEKVNIVAHSMGGVIAVLFTKMFSHRVNKLILAEASLNAENAKISQKIVDYGSEEGFIKGFESFVGSFNKPRKPAAFRFYNTLVQSTPYCIYRSAVSLLKHIQPPHYEELLTLRVPTFYIRGQDSYHSITNKIKKDLTDHNIPLFSIPSAGHGMMEDNPEAFYDVVCRILFELK